MTYPDYLLYLFYLIDTELEALHLPRLRHRGPHPRLHDSEVITMELAGEFLGLDTDTGIWNYFRRHHLAEFPLLAKVDRSIFARQAANLWRLKQLLQQRILELLPHDNPVAAGPLWLMDSFPLRVCRFKRAPGHKLFRGYGAAYGRDPTGEELFYGYRVHLRCSERGWCAAFDLAPANVPDVVMVDELMPQQGGTVIADRVYWNPQLQEWLLEQGKQLLAPFRKKTSDPMPQFSALLTRLRQIIEPVIGQLATRFHCQRTWARDLWHLTLRLTRKILSHTTAVLLNWREGHPPLRLDLLISS